MNRLLLFLSLLAVIGYCSCVSQSIESNGQDVESTPVTDESMERAIESTFCLSWSDHEFESYLFYQEQFGEKYKSIKMFGTDNSICADFDSSSVAHYFVLPYGGKAITKEEIEANSVIKNLERREFLVIHEMGRVDSVITVHKLKRINKALKALYLNFQIELLYEPLDEIFWNDESIDNSFAELIETFDIELGNRKHIILPSNTIMDSPFISGSGFHYEYADNVHLYAGDDSLLYRQFLTLHEICHFTLSDVAQGTRFEDEVHASVLALMGNITDYCHYYIDVSDIMFVHGLNGRLAEDDEVIRTQDLEKNCNFYEHFDVDGNFDPDLSSVVVTKRPLGGTNFIPSDWADFVDEVYYNSLNNIFAIGNSPHKVYKSLEMQRDNILVKLERKYLSDLNRILNTTFTLNDLKDNRTAISKNINIYNKQFDKIVVDGYSSKFEFYKTGSFKRRLSDFSFESIPKGQKSIILYNKLGESKTIEVKSLLKKTATNFSASG